MDTTAWTTYESPIGPLTLVGGPRGLRGVSFPHKGGPVAETARNDELLAPALAQLDEYFTGGRTRFELELDLHGTPFQRSVWATLLGIPFGATTTYGRIAQALGRADRVRAVGAAVGRTPVPIIVPCHRVLGADGSLTGYGGGLHRKQTLLDLERDVVAARPPSPAPRQLALV